MGMHNNYQSARQAGLNHEWATKVALRETSLDKALGDMDMDSESVNVGESNYDTETYCSKECKEFGGCDVCDPCFVIPF